MLKYLKKKIKGLSNRIIESNKKVDKIELLDKKIRRLTYLLNDIYPEKIYLNENNKEIIYKILKAYKIDISSINTSVSKSDLMFHYWLLNCPSIGDAIYGYFNSGIKNTLLLKKIFEQYHLDLKNIKVLDFASGHGRVTRFLVNHLNEKNFWISDIKQSAIDFQRNEFKVNTLISGKTPSEFNINIPIDFIIVSSLFTHLPEELFKTWFVKLYSVLSQKGILCITTHDIKTTSYKSSFKFIPSSEETLFPEYEENLDHMEIYGTTYISEEKIKSILEELNLSKLKVKRYPKLWEGQDLYLFSTTDLEGINFE